MPTYWIRPGPSDVGGQSTYGNGSGDSYQNAIAGLGHSSVAALMADPDNHFRIAGRHLRQSATLSGAVVLTPAGGPSPSARMVIRGDHPTDPGRIWAHFVYTGTALSSYGGPPNTFRSTSFGSLAVDGEPNYVFYGATNPRMLTRVYSVAACEATPNSFYAETTSPFGFWCRLLDGETPAGNLILPRYGYVFQLDGASPTSRRRNLLFDSLWLSAGARFCTQPSVGSARYQPHDVMWRNCTIEYGNANIIEVSQAVGLHWDGCTIGRCGTGAAIYLRGVGAAYEDGAAAGSEKRAPDYNNRIITIADCRIHTVGYDTVHSHGDSHGIGIQYTEQLQIIGCDIHRTYGGIVYWRGSSDLAVCDGVRIEHCDVRDGHGGTAVDANNRIKGIVASDGGEPGLFRHHRVRYNTVRRVDYTTPAGMHTLAPLSIAYAASRPENTPMVVGNHIVDHPMGPRTAPGFERATIRHTVVARPAGHSVLAYGSKDAATSLASVERNQYVGTLPDASAFRSLTGTFANGTAISRASWQTAGYDAAGSVFTPQLVEPLAIDGNSLVIDGETLAFVGP